MIRPSNLCSDHFPNGSRLSKTAGRPNQLLPLPLPLSHPLMRLLVQLVRESRSDGGLAAVRPMEIHLLQPLASRLERYLV